MEAVSSIPFLDRAHPGDPLNLDIRSFDEVLPHPFNIFLSGFYPFLDHLFILPLFVQPFVKPWILWITGTPSWIMHGQASVVIDACKLSSLPTHYPQLRKMPVTHKTHSSATAATDRSLLPYKKDAIPLSSMFFHVIQKASPLIGNAFVISIPDRTIVRRSTNIQFANLNMITWIPDRDLSGDSLLKYKTSDLTALPHPTSRQGICSHFPGRKNRTNISQPQCLQGFSDLVLF